MKKFWFKHEAWGEDWQEFQVIACDVYEAAEQVAENYWNDEPTDPSCFTFEVDIKKEDGTVVPILVTAEADVHFNSCDRKPVAEVATEVQADE